MIYEAMCTQCDHVEDYSASVADRDKSLPKHCGKKMQRVLLTPPQVGAMTWTGWKGMVVNGRYIDSGSEYKRYLKSNDLIPTSEANQQADHVRKQRAMKEEKQLNDTVERVVSQAGI